MTQESCEQVRPRSKTVSLVAYCALPPNQVFLRVPNERGRWLITERCAVEVDCDFCGVSAGEPCVSRSGHYGVGVHIWRRETWRQRGKPGNKQQHKPRLSTADMSCSVAPLYPEAPTP